MAWPESRVLGCHCLHDFALHMSHSLNSCKGSGMRDYIVGYLRGIGGVQTIAHIYWERAAPTVCHDLGEGGHSRLRASG